GRQIGRRRAGSIALLERAIAAVEACDPQFVPLAVRRFGVDQHLRLVAPFLPFVGAANAAQEMQRAEDLGEPLQIVVIGRWPVLRRLVRFLLLLRLRLWLSWAGRRAVEAR